MTSNQEQYNKESMDVEKINSEEIKVDEQSTEIEDTYKFGWSNYSEITNGRFAMLGFLAIILIELISQKSFFNWVGIF
ncbi:possible high light inducible protein [Prochlorococcus marinus str. MIT 9515]|uniref:Possible high light inducible protein n=1 Tax=Prochlorococcus marinus (strain MIT 9515) TaxID=167542 RepID=A2BU21_PROM5|nr:chlorophyll a/b-binding protein [Prochlorococcus marinus]ABM71282.1 possible high light inducible protein [Prochlorococcus marinus str. MIT 9515]